MPDHTLTSAPDAGIAPERISTLNTRPPGKGEYVLYWMQQSQRVHWNHVLEYAVLKANELNRPLIVCFALTDNFPEANMRHYAFMLEGLSETARELEKRNIRLILRTGDPDKTVLALAKNASEIICDMGYTRIQRQWRQSVADQSPCRVTGIETDVVVPVATVSEKAEYAARTIRPKILKQVNRFVHPVQKTAVRHPSLSLKIRGEDLSDPEKILTRLNLDASVPKVSRFFRGGTTNAIARFENFMEGPIRRYIQNSNQPQTDDTSQMSPYLHFGQISPVYLAWKIQHSTNLDSDIRDGYLEELIVRRELAVNFVYYTEDYDSYTSLPAWAQKTLKEHLNDPREYTYKLKELEAAATHDTYWNAAMNEMKITGYMHNYMRMYWGKKILEWTPDPETAFKTVLTLNNKYFLDGRDPNSFAGVAWIFGLHDRAWKERDVFGKIRYMKAAGLERKCDIKAYVTKVENLKRIAGRPSDD